MHQLPMLLQIKNKRSAFSTIACETVGTISAAVPSSKSRAELSAPANENRNSINIENIDVGGVSSQRFQDLPLAEGDDPFSDSFLFVPTTTV